jgi:RNA polymerase sigma factor (sigma-70 family)
MNMEGEDSELLREYVANKSEPAFRALVERHVDMVYATALRQVQEAHLAEEATQAVFIALAQKAPTLSSATILAGWLFRAAQFAGAKAQRTEARRKHWEHQAAQMEPHTSDGESAWEQIAPHLNDALNQLKEPDRDALILRFFDRKSIAQVGSALGTTESATRMRIARALEQLRGIFQARGIALPIALLTAALSVPATHAAPVGLAATIATSALLQQTTIPLLTKGTLLLMTTSKTKLALTGVAAITVLLLSSGATALVTYHVVRHHYESAARAAHQPGEPASTFAMDAEGGEPAFHRTGGSRGTLRIVNADGTVVITNGVDELVVIEGGETNRLSVTPGRARRAISYRAAGGAGGPGGLGGGAGFGGEAGGGEVFGGGAGFGGGVGGGAGVPGTPARTPQ